METVEQSPILTAMQSPERFKLLEDGWIKDVFLGLDWGPSSEEDMEFKDAEKFCADKGGRLPELHELHSLVDFTKEQPAINPSFKDQQSSYYWSATRTAWSKTARWVVGFYFGGVDDGGEDVGFYVRPCRSSQ